MDKTSSQKLHHSTESVISSLKKKNSVPATIALNILTHKMAKYAGTDISPGDNRRLTQHDAFIYRAKIVGESFKDQ